jgi:hypothetical protein
VHDTLAQESRGAPRIDPVSPEEDDARIGGHGGRIGTGPRHDIGAGGEGSAHGVDGGQWEVVGGLQHERRPAARADECGGEVCQECVGVGIVSTVQASEGAQRAARRPGLERGDRGLHPRSGEIELRTRGRPELDRPIGAEERGSGMVESDHAPIIAANEGAPEVVHTPAPPRSPWGG